MARKTIADYEGGRKKRPYPQTLKKLQACLEAAGVEFTNGNRPGVRLRKAAAIRAVHRFANGNRPGVRLRKGGT